MADPKRDAPHHPSHPGNYAGKIPDNRSVARRGGTRPVIVILAVLVIGLLGVWFMIGGAQLGEQTLGEPVGVGESATAVDREAGDIESPHGAIGEASEASTVLAPEVIDQDAEVTGEAEVE